MNPTLSPTVEDYLKAVYEATIEKAVEIMSLGDLARHLAITPGTATTMVKHIAEDGYLEYFSRKGCRLTALGIEAARNVQRRHRLLEFFLVKILEMDWSEVHEEAERLEHAVSEKILERLDRFLGYPESDPHGHPIPRGETTVLRPRLTLADLLPGTTGRILWIDEEDSRLLTFFGKSGIRPGLSVRVEGRDTGAGIVTVSLEDGPQLAMSFASAVHILIGPESATDRNPIENEKRS